MSNDDIHSLSGAYAVDAVDDVERAGFEAHLAECSQCETEVASLTAAAAQLSSITLSAPPPSLRESVLRDITSVRPIPPVVIATSAPTSLDTKRSERTERTKRTERIERTRRATPRQWLVGVAAAAVLATGGIVWQPWSNDTSTVQLTAMEQVLQAKDAQSFEEKVGGGTATVVRSPSLKKAVIVTANMPDAPQGKVYELWLQQGTEMVRAGLMPAGQANTVLLDGDAATAAAVGITVEPAGGSDKPTTAPVAVIRFV